MLTDAQRDGIHVCSSSAMGGESVKRILLVSTDVDCDVAPYEEIFRLPFVTTKAMMAPLHLATVAALTPEDIEVDIWDEPVHGRIDASTEFGKKYDLVGITGYVLHLERAKEVAQVFRRRGILTAIGGIGVSAAPEVCRDFFDILFIGEAELTWPRFIADWKSGSHRSEYRQVAKPDMAVSPIPKWDRVASSMASYVWGPVQTTRGCPFGCEFCDVVYLHGRRPRQKPIVQVLEEVSALERLGMTTVFFCDDNFVGNTSYAKDLLRELIRLNESFEYPVAFITQISIDVAKDEKLLELLADANFTGLFIGVETPNKESLIETHKPQNYKTDLLADVRKIQSYGMAIRAGMIVGFDHDDARIFDDQFNFLQESWIPMLSTHILRAPVGTPLWARLHEEGRIVLDEEHEIYGNLHGANTNIVPLKMTRVELFEGYLRLVERLSDWSGFELRLKAFVSGVKRKPDIPKNKRPVDWHFLLGAMKYLFFSLNGETRRSTLRILRHTRRHAPFMVRRVLGLIGLQYSRAAMLRSVRQGLLDRIALEKSADFKLQIDTSDLAVPESLRKTIRNAFPEIYGRVCTDLADKTHVEETLIYIFRDFITHQGKTLESFTDEHRAFLSDIVDRTIAAQNGTGYDGSSVPPRHMTIPLISTLEAADEVLKAVEQELRGKLAPTVEVKKR